MTGESSSELRAAYDGYTSRQNSAGDRRITGNWACHGIRACQRRCAYSGSLRSFRPGCGIPCRWHSLQRRTRECAQSGFGDSGRTNAAGEGSSFDRRRAFGCARVQQLLPVLGEGSNIIVISSLGARAVVGKPGLDNPSILAYAATKGALETLVKNWAAILGPQGIRVNAVAPGVIDTDMSNFTKAEVGREVTLGMQALKRIGKPEDVADVVAFLASDKARWITGASIPVDGGSKL